MQLKINRDQILNDLLAQQSTQGTRTITIDDTGNKQFTVFGENGESFEVKGTYYLANLLQEVWLGNGELDTEKVLMKPLERVDYLMKNHYWNVLSRRMNADNVLANLFDEKRSSEKSYLYVPAADVDGLAYYHRITAQYDNIEIIELPAPPYSADLLKEIDEKAGLLALKYDKETDQPLPYVVPGGRFNEMYGWDSYFIGLGLMAHDQYELARGMLENIAYQIKYYGKMLNANRSYYLTRSQPPFYTPYLAAFYRQYADRLPENWLAEHLAIAIQEYEQVWQNPNTHYFADIGLNHYFDEGVGRPKETEEGHFRVILQQFADKHGMNWQDFEREYDSGSLKEPELDRYFEHDRAMRESGHDTTTRLDDVCADTACVDLNAILYRVEADIAQLLLEYYPQGFEFAGQTYSYDRFFEYAEKRYLAMQQYLWNEADGTFYDYNHLTKKQNAFVSASNLFPLWAKACSPTQAKRAVASQLPQLLRVGGIASTAPISGSLNVERQWDYPYGWAPHQILIWEGLQHFGFADEMYQAAFAWVQTIVRATVEYNGLIPEKFNVEQSSHKTNVEYGNVGAVFDYVPAGGFGWTNASLILGIAKLTQAQKDELNTLADSTV
ncbi:trehalase family glycosidase [Alysiella crassa]|uniref:Cytoplasmic trehalase n=1 Tax=Alysiella crassa TaxID=153491 RepID=A0A376BN70_9NEIS|nr:trehalase family glycosidase [Alysiella crassa]UOP06773.1 alpha,alpha-trehalase [Alysiella crassa]SSY71110.1 Cytoplasmic trehalase [Alysiella crassa]